MEISWPHSRSTISKIATNAWYQYHRNPPIHEMFFWYWILFCLSILLSFVTFISSLPWFSLGLKIFLFPANIASMYIFNQQNSSLTANLPWFIKYHRTSENSECEHLLWFWCKWICKFLEHNRISNHDRTRFLQIYPSSSYHCYATAYSAACQWQSKPKQKAKQNNVSPTKNCKLLQVSV